jgi:dihydrofolate reductase
VADIVLVAAVARNGVIGAGGGLPWRVKADLQRFRATTMGKPLVMGRKTFQSIGRALDGRDNIVLSRQPELPAEGALLAPNLDAGLAMAEECAVARGAKEICVIGGAEVFRQALPRAARLYITHIQAEPEGDVLFPDIPPDSWTEVARESLPVGEGDTARAVHVVYERR